MIMILYKTKPNWYKFQDPSVFESERWAVRNAGTVKDLDAGINSLLASVMSVTKSWDCLAACSITSWRRSLVTVGLVDLEPFHVSQQAGNKAHAYPQNTVW